MKKVFAAAMERKRLRDAGAGPAAGGRRFMGLPIDAREPTMRKGGKVKKMAKGGKVRGCGIAKRGLTKGKMR